ncbi:hypothetical protein HBB16_14995 [Pseudonocardia sp. MCCB 268]|nr:hypothetical protein [Pseudonocardia cytotoxica]
MGWPSVRPLHEGRTRAVMSSCSIAYHRAVDHPAVQGSGGVAQAGVENVIGKVRGDRGPGRG